MSNFPAIDNLHSPGTETDAPLRLSINLMREYDWLVCLEFGRVDDGQDPDCWVGLEGWDDRVGLLYDKPLGKADAKPVGFKILDFSEFVEELESADPAWEGPVFHVPQLGLDRATVAEIAVATNALFPEESTPNRYFFNSAAANHESPEAALEGWLVCLASGDSMAHFGVGTTLYELGRFHDAYRHLRYYAQIAPAEPWNLVWYGKAAEAIGENSEAVKAYDAAIEIEKLSAQEEPATDAAELLDALLQRMGEDGP